MPDEAGRHGRRPSVPGGVLFLALGGNRRRGTVEESTLVVDAGGRASVVVSDVEPWRRSGLDPRIHVIDISYDIRPQVIARLDHALGSSLPRLVVRGLGRGPLRAWLHRAERAYQRRVATALHRRVVAMFPARGGTHQVLARRLGDVAFDHVVICDAVSMPVAAHLVRYYAARGKAPTICYGLDDVDLVAVDRAGRAV